MSLTGTPCLIGKGGRSDRAASSTYLLHRVSPFSSPAFARDCQFRLWTGDAWSCDSCIPIPFPRLSEHLSSKDSPLTRRLGVSESNFPWIGRIRFHQPHADRAAKRNEHLKQGKSLVSPAGRICVHPALALSPIPQAHNACMGLLLARCPGLLHLPGLRAATEWSEQSLTRTCLPRKIKKLM